MTINKKQESADCLQAIFDAFDHPIHSGYSKAATLGRMSFDHDGVRRGSQHGPHACLAVGALPSVDREGVYHGTRLQLAHDAHPHVLHRVHCWYYDELSLPATSHTTHPC